MDPAPDLQAVTGDASPRRYFRLHCGNGSFILVDAPPASEKNEAFVQIAALLASSGVRVPRVLGVDFSRGFMLLEDLGDRLLLPALDAESVSDHYGRAFAVLECMARVDITQTALPDYGSALLAEETGRFGEWFVQRLLRQELAAEEQSLLDALQRRLIDSALQQPRVLVHRDFHSRNLMLTADGGLAVIDFQDAVAGPVTYDLVSLLRDCYIRWPDERVRGWALAYRDRLCAQGLLDQTDDRQFLRWFDWMGLQRHLKVLGTFARLSLRDGKSAYLEDLPRVIAYVRDVARLYADDEPEFAGFSAWFERCLAPLIAQQPWSRAA